MLSIIQVSIMKHRRTTLSMKNNTRGSEEHITKSHLLIVMLSAAMLSDVILSDKSLY